MLGLTVTDYLLGALEIWGAVLCVLAALFTKFANRTNPVGSNYMIKMQLICSVMMLSAVVSGFTIGSTEPHAYYTVRIGYFLCFSGLLRKLEIACGPDMFYNLTEKTRGALPRLNEKRYSHEIMQYHSRRKAACRRSAPR